MKKFLLSAFAACSLLGAQAAPSLNWAYLADTSNSEYTYSFTKTTDNNFVSLTQFGTKATAESLMFNDEAIGSGAVTSSTAENYNLALIKHDKNGKKVWAIYSKQGYFEGANSSVVATNDGGVLLFIKVRATENNGYVSPVLVDASGAEIEFYEFPTRNKVSNAMLVKVSAEGNVQWTRHFAMDELPVPDATEKYADATTNALFTYGLALDSDENIYIGGNFRTPMVLTGEKNSHFILQPRNLAGYTGDTQAAAGGLFLVKLDSDGDYLGHVKVKGDLTREQISGLAYADGKIYFYGNVQGADGATLTMGDKSITMESTFDGILYGAISTDLSVEFLRYIKPYAASNNKNSIQLKALRVIDGNIFMLGHLLGGLSAANENEARIATSGTLQEGFVIKCDATDGSWISAKDNTGMSIGGYYDVFKSGSDLYLYGYQMNATTGVYIEKYADNNDWEMVERNALLAGGGSPTTASNCLYDSTSGNIVVSLRGNKAVTLAGSEDTLTPSSWGSVIASFNISGNSAVAAVAADTSYSTDKDAVIVTTAAPLAVAIYNAAGMEVANTTVAAGTTRFPLSQGVYMVNGNKLIVKQ
jgi:hypothetical protein